MNSVNRENPVCHTFEEVFNYYKTRSQEIMTGNVLKTDCYNEGFGRPIIEDERATLVEVDEENIKKAKEANPKLNIIKGDIRELTFDKEFDVILDLSTIDHIKEDELEKVFTCYQKALKPNGKILIIAWMTDVSFDLDKVWEPKDQYFFNEKIFKNIFDRHFKRLEEKVIMDYKSSPCMTNTYLYEIYGVGIS